MIDGQALGGMASATIDSSRMRIRDLVAVLEWLTAQTRASWHEHRVQYRQYGVHEMQGVVETCE